MLSRAGDRYRIRCRLVHFEQRRFFFCKVGFANFKKSSIFLFFIHICFSTKSEE